MPKMLDESILTIPNIRYNSDIKYEEGDDVLQKEKDNLFLTRTGDDALFEYSLYLKNAIAKYKPEMETYQTKCDIQSIDDLISTRETKIFKLNIDSFKDFKNVIKSKEAKNISYYAQNDTLEIPESLNQDVKEYKVICYNKGNEFVKHELLKDYKVEDVPSIKFKYIPEDIVCSKIKKDCKVLLDKEHNTYGIFKNLKVDDFNLLPPMVYDVIYDLDTKEFDFDTSNFVKSNLICKDIAEYGLINPIPIFIKDNTFYSDASSQVISCKYLGVKEIPVCLIKSDYILPLNLYETKMYNEITYQKIIEILYPFYL